MSEYTVRYCHLEYIPKLLAGSVLSRGMSFCRIGNTGQSSGIHLHIDCVEGLQKNVWTLNQMESNIITSAPRQLNYFIDNELFNSPIYITTYYNDPQYQKDLGKVHLAYDVVPLNRKETTNNYDVYWNRSFEGIVLSSGYNDGYGNYINIGFST